MSGQCEGCGEREWRYTCPGCGRKSCSVACVRRHKTEMGCQGKRCKTKFVSLTSFTTEHLLNDYHFLEEAGRVSDSAHRGWQALSRRQRDARERRQTLQRLQSVARKRGSTLRLLPPGMGRHQLNTSRTAWNRDRKEWGIEWRVGLVFPQAALEHSEERVCESRLLGDLLRRYTHPSESDPVIRHRLRCYVGKEVAVFLRQEMAGRAARFCRLQLHCSLEDCLRHRTIVEFPELHVVLTSSPSLPDYTLAQGEEGGPAVDGLHSRAEGGLEHGSNATDSPEAVTEAAPSSLPPSSLGLLASPSSLPPSSLDLLAAPSSLPPSSLGLLAAPSSLPPSSLGLLAACYGSDGDSDNT